MSGTEPEREPQPARLEADRLASPARRLVARRVVTFDLVGSTNDEAFGELMRGGDDASGTALFAEAQTAGRGRRGRTWVSRPGLGVLVSIALRVEPPPPPAALVAAAAVAVREAILEEARVDPRIKWPNDLLVAGRKVCGILVEARGSGPRADVALGIGVNCNGDPDQDLEPGHRGAATSLAAAAGRPIDRARFARALLDRLDERLASTLRGDVREIEAEFLDGLGLAGRRVRLGLPDGEVTGVLRRFDVARGVDLETPEERRWIAAETIAHALPA